MHLLGIDSKTLKANEFYDKCVAHNHGLDAGISIIDCTPSRNHNRTTVNEKVPAVQICFESRMQNT